MKARKEAKSLRKGMGKDLVQYMGTLRAQNKADPILIREEGSQPKIKEVSENEEDTYDLLYES